MSGREYVGNPRELSPAALAFIGDGVFGLMVKERLILGGTLPARKLHKLAMERVNATAQAGAFFAIEEALTEEERGIFIRGRNANGRVAPKSCSMVDYRKATAIEALFGYLYLKKDTQRLGELFDVFLKTIENLGED